MTEYITRHGTLTAAVDLTNAVNIETSGAGTSNPQVPVGVSAIKRILAQIGASVVAIASGGVNIVLRLGGSAVDGAPIDIVVGGIREDTTSTGGAHITPPNVIDVDIPIIAGNALQLEAFQKGIDAGSPSLTVTLVIE